jgi:tRNA G10  N-methylase Trm11
MCYFSTGESSAKTHFAIVYDETSVWYTHQLPTNHEASILLTRYSLATRPLLSPTSMDVRLSFVMANLARIAHSRSTPSRVCDPCIGTGSTLLPAAHYGAYCVGSDFDPYQLT